MSIDDAALQPFRATFRGELIRPGDPRYDRARRVWNGMVDRHPTLIARCTGVADVIAAVGFARDREVPLAVRGGGHSLPGFSSCDGGVVVDLSPMKGVRVDPERRVAVAEAGLTLGEFDRATQAFGLATPAGVVSDTGLAGLTLGGGVGMLMRRYGLTIDNLLSADVVTADGRLVHASASENEDLFWGLRGGGGNFGVVTSFEFQLHPVGPDVVGGFMAWPEGSIRDVCRFYREAANSFPDEFTSVLALFTVPSEPPYPAPLHGRPAVMVAGCHCGGPDDAERTLRPLRGFGPPAVDLFGPVPFLSLQRVSDASFPWGRRYYMKVGFMEGLPDEAIDVMIDHLTAAPAPTLEIDIHHLGGAVARVGEDDTAFSNRAAPFAYDLPSAWDDPADDELNIGWTKGVVSALAPFWTGGTYVNADADEGEAVIRSVYGGKLDRLVALKGKYDPTNLFRLNQNIPPG